MGEEATTERSVMHRTGSQDHDTVRRIVLGLLPRLSPVSSCTIDSTVSTPSHSPPHPTHSPNQAKRVD